MNPLFEEGAEKPFEADYAKSSRSLCRKCRSKIGKDSLRFGAYIFHRFDHEGGVEVFWYHTDCFFKLYAQALPKSTDDIKGFAALTAQDQQQVEKTLNRVHLAESAEHQEQKVVEYAKSGTSRCRLCRDVIEKGTVRVGVMGKTDYYGEAPSWHHVACFFASPRGDCHAKSIEEFDGWQNISLEDQRQFTFGEGQNNPVVENQQQMNKRYNDTKKKVLEYAKSGRSKCRSCMNAIPKAAVRLGVMEWNGYAIQPSWYHIICFFSSPYGKNQAKPVEEFDGWQSITLEDQQQIKKDITGETEVITLEGAENEGEPISKVKQQKTTKNGLGNSQARAEEEEKGAKRSRAGGNKIKEAKKAKKPRNGEN